MYVKLLAPTVFVGTHSGPVLNSSVFTSLFQMCADSGQIPTMWKTSNLIPVSKSKQLLGWIISTYVLSDKHFWETTSTITSTISSLQGCILSPLLYSMYTDSCRSTREQLYYYIFRRYCLFYRELTQTMAMLYLPSLNGVITIIWI